nr:IS3 family transposase [Enterococcus gilvus]
MRKLGIEAYIYYYNHERMKGKLNWQSPVKFREAALRAA